jgi:hypothetical protein
MQENSLPGERPDRQQRVRCELRNRLHSGDRQRRQRIGELYQVWWNHYGDDPVKAADLAEAVRNLIDPQGCGRQFIASYLGQLSGTRAAGFVLDTPESEKQRFAHHFAR